MNNYSGFKQESISGRYVTNADILPLLNNLSEKFKVSVLGKSVKQHDVYKVQFGSGSIKVLMWSQMHGNESTATKSLFDLFNYLEVNSERLNNLNITIVPILNPDGAEVYTRLNANNEDLNRDFQRLSQPESNLLKQLFNDYKPNYCFNLHDQRTIFSAGATDKTATISFLSPSVDEMRTITTVRKQAMEIIAKMNTHLQTLIPNQVGRYDDGFNLNCVGDTFQSNGVPTILFEAGHCANDYQRENTRQYIFEAVLVALKYVSDSVVSGEDFGLYFDIPENKKLFYDIIIRNARLDNKSDRVFDIAVQYVETLNEKKLFFVPRIEKISDLSNYYAHKEIDANNNVVSGVNGGVLAVGNENDFVLINNEKLSLKV